MCAYTIARNYWLVIIRDVIGFVIEVKFLSEQNLFEIEWKIRSCYVFTLLKLNSPKHCNFQRCITLIRLPDEFLLGKVNS